MENNTPTIADHTAEWYKSYYARKGANRNDVLSNRGVLFQLLATERSLLEALRSLDIKDRSSLRVLDVGCGGGTGLLSFVKCGFSPATLYGVDLLEDRITQAKVNLPGAHLLQTDACKLPYESAYFDIVYESTMFAQLSDRSVRASIAKEMIRVAKQNGAIILTDWQYRSSFMHEKNGLTKGDVNDLFLKYGWSIQDSYAGALVPPLGRFLSAYAPAFYFLVAKIPFLVGCRSWVLKRI